MLTNGNQKHSAKNGVLCRSDDPPKFSPLCFPLVPSTWGEENRAGSVSCFRAAPQSTGVMATRLCSLSLNKTKGQW